MHTARSRHGFLAMFATVSMVVCGLVTSGGSSVAQAPTVIVEEARAELPAVRISPPVGSISGGPWQTSQRFDTKTISIDGEGYNVMTNAWGIGSGQQTVTIGGAGVFRVDQFRPGGSGVQSFPAVYRGFAQDGAESPRSGLPRRVGSLSSVRTALSTNARSIDGTFNTAYDVYFRSTNDTSPGPPDIFLMVWLNTRPGFNPTVNGGRGYSCGNTVPVGIDSCPEPEVVSIPGAGDFNVFVGLQHEGKMVISYVRTEPTDSLEFDLKDVIDDAVTNGYTVAGRDPLSVSHHLYSVMAGFEIESGGTGLSVSNFSAVPN